MTTANKLTEAPIIEHGMGQEWRRARQKMMGVWKMTSGEERNVGANKSASDGTREEPQKEIKKRKIELRMPRSRVYSQTGRKKRQCLESKDPGKEKKKTSFWEQQ